MSQIALPSQRREILDWYHLKENLYKVQESPRRLKQLEALLWRGQTQRGLGLIDEWKRLGAQNCCGYIRKHREWIVDYQQQQQDSSIGSGSVESTVKQLGRRIQISGAQWKAENINQVLRQRCAYLDGRLGLFTKAKID